MKEVIQLQSKAILKQYRAHTQAKTLVKTSTKNTWKCTKQQWNSEIWKLQC